MFLKELQMSGFKSFAQTVQIQLGPGVTAVVGPNGSGKSNIVDAVRWVLGEQSARVLRGARSEDVIFSGSAMRRPLGMAEVTLVLDNANRRVDIDLEEVAVARRLYRSGDTEYMLNHRRARLRDVLDVAGQAGLGPDSYCVVGQGAIEQLALMRPQERRSLIADAADVRRYEARLAEIESDLTQTQQNALRVSAVVAEVRPQLDRLRVQADRAQRHRDFRAEAEKLAAAWYGRALPAARAEREAAERRGRTLQQHVDAIRAQLATIDQRRLAIHDGAEQLRQRAAMAARELQDARAGREQDRLERATAAERLHAAVNRVAAVQTELLDLASQLAVARQALAESTAAAESAVEAQPAAVDQAAALGDVRAQLDRARVARDRVDQLLQQQRAALVQLEREEMRLQARIEAAQASAGQRRDAEARVAELREQLARAEAALAAARQQLGDVEGRHAAARAEADRRANARRSVEDALNKTRRALDGLIGEERALARLRAQSTGPAAHLLVDELPVAPALRRAILVALGEAARYQIVDATDTAWFVSESTTRQDAEPVLVPRRRAPGTESDGFAAWVAAELGSEVPYRTAVDVIENQNGTSGLAARYLGSTIIVATIDDARLAATRLHRAPGSIGFQVASEDGHCLRSNGEHRVGPRAAEVQALEVQERHAALTQSIEQARSETAAEEEKISVANAALVEAQRAVRAVEDERTRMANAMREPEFSVRGLRAELEAEEKRIARFAIAETGGEDRTQLDEILKKQDEARAAIAEREAELRDRSDELAAAQAEHRAVAEQQAAVTAQRALAQERRARLRDAKQRDAREAERVAARHQALESEAARLQQEESQLDERVKALDLQLRAWDQRVEVLETGAVAANAAVAENTAALEAIAHEFESSQERLADLRAEQATAGADAEHASGSVGRLEAELAGITEALAIEPSDLLKLRDVDGELVALDDTTLQRRLVRAQRELRSVGAVDYGVLAEYNAIRDRYQYLTDQLDDLTRAETVIREGMAEARERMRTQFLTAFGEANERFKEMFRELFRGGDAELVLSGDPDSPQCGIDIEAQPPGKRLHRLATLSGGERSLVGAALLLGLIGVNPSPFCMLDEVDAALDETNVARFVATIREMSRATQFILVTHNRATMEMADALYGVTMSPGAVSQIVAVRLEALPV